MRESPAPKRFVIVLLLAVLFGSLPAKAQKPQKPPKRDSGAKDNQAARGVKDNQVAPGPPLVLGPYYALVIGNNDYRSPSLPKLLTPINDANALARLLRDKYGFKVKKPLLNATRDDIFAALIDYRNTLPENSNLLIFFAGHGYHDHSTDEAYWLPVDAQKGNPDHWISANDITTNIKAIPAKHILVISDSCYSGVLTRDADVGIRPLDPGNYLWKMLSSKSRTLMSSGGDEPVVDSGDEGHSVFANAVLKYLKEMEDAQFTAADLFPRIRRGVAGRTTQVPQYSYIRNSGDQFGDFVFSRGGGIDIIEPKNYGPLPQIACLKELAPGLPPKIQQGDMVPCRRLDEPLQWLKPYDKPELPAAAAQGKWTAMLTVTVDETGKVTDIKPRGGASLRGMDAAFKAAAQLWQTNPPTYLGMSVKSSFAFDIDLGQ